MNPKSHRRISISVSCAIVVVTAAACATSRPAGPTEDPTGYQQTIEAALSAPTDTAVNAFTPTLTRTPASTEPLEATKTATRVEPSIVLPGWVPQGARVRIGRGTINQIAVSPDGKNFAVAGATGLFLYNMETFEEVWGIPTSIPMTHVSFSSDGKTLASLSQRVTPAGFPDVQIDFDSIYIWDATTGQFQREIPISETGINHIGIAFSPDGKKLAVGKEIRYEQTGAVDIWDLPSGKLQRTIKDVDVNGAESMAFSAHGEILAVGSWYGVVTLWNSANGELIRNFKEIGSDLNAIALSQDGKLLAVGIWKSVKIFSITGNIRLPDLDGFSGSIRDLAFSPDGKWLAAGDETGTVLQWKPESGIHVHTFNNPGEGVRSIAFSSGGLLLAGFADSIHLWNSTDGQSVHIIDDPFSSWEEAQFSSDGSELGLRTEDRIVWLNAFTNKQLVSYNIPSASVLSPDYRMYAYVSSPNKIIIVDIRDAKPLYSLERPDYMGDFGYWNFVLSPDGKTAATIQYNEYAHIPDFAEFWDLGSGKLLSKLAFPMNGSSDPWYMIFSPDGNRVALGSWDWEFGMDAAVFDVDTGEEYPGAGGHGDFIFAFSPDGYDYFTQCEESYGICLVDGDTGKDIRLFTDPPIWINNTPRFSPDGKLLAAGTDSGPVYVWDTATGKIRHSFSGHNGAIIFLSFSTDAKTLASTSADGTVVVWDLN